MVSACSGMVAGWMVGAVTQFVYSAEWMVLTYSAVAAVPGYALCWVWLRSRTAPPAPPAPPAPEQPEPIGLTTWRELRTHAYGDHLPYDVAALRERLSRVEDRLVGVETRRAEQQANDYRRDQP
jgi:hypothetical protein